MDENVKGSQTWIEWSLANQKTTKRLYEEDKISMLKKYIQNKTLQGA